MAKRLYPVLSEDVMDRPAQRVFTVHDPRTGRVLHVTGPTHPSQKEAAQMFKQITPWSIMGAPEGVESALLKDMIQHPDHGMRSAADIRRMGGAAKDELMKIARGHEPSAPSTVLNELGATGRPGVPRAGVAGLAADLFLDPMNAVVAGESVPVNIAKNLAENTPQMVMRTRRLYTKLVEEVLTQMNRPLEPAKVVRLIERAGIGAEAKAAGLVKWILKQGDKYLTRSRVVRRLLLDQEFMKILADHGPAHLRATSLGVEAQNKVMESGSEYGATREEPHPIWRSILAMVGAFGGLTPDMRAERMSLPRHPGKTLGSRLYDAAELSGVLPRSDSVEAEDTAD